MTLYFGDTSNVIFHSSLYLLICEFKHSSIRWFISSLSDNHSIGQTFKPCFCSNLVFGIPYTLDRFTKTFFWNFQNIRAVLCYILIDKQMLEKAFCSNITLSLSSGNHLFYKAEYMGPSCPNQVWAITFDWSALATWNKHFWTAFW